MTSTIISGFLTYTLITALTPGPNNILALSSVNQYGLRRSIRVLMGMSAGFLVLMLACGAFTFTLISLLPSLTGWLVWIGAGYILWLAWRIASRSPTTSNGSGHPLSFWLQFANVKIILYGITALSAFVLPYTQDIFWVTAVSILLAVIGCVGNLVWALAGHLFKSLFRRHGQVVNLVLALLLVYCAARMFF
ncbi:cysteine/O-acetylserine transporter [Candidatus Symbiopectobacterium sp. 'North America']|uniref:cysteine/O-acetylserine transporter n=1 Tax=Candidatus Symbiopectobacterium sp. 'North America' TaxID=2794574 RepID=UPI0018C90407|nr:cysteine/O-acetylserine transporter [Candidatus Symbiopectobacterium sp. 'North America']MBG6243984.1 cysteine/O-acetylserine transporter [Candidatus Symbiopectobacterium sp. 'North America']